MEAQCRKGEWLNGELSFAIVVFYRHAVGHSHVVGLVDGRGNTVVEYSCDAWGKLLSTTGSLASTLGVDNPIRYRWHYYDIETGLY